MLVATILAVLFELPAFVTVFQGPVEYQGITITSRGSSAVVSTVSNERLIRQGVRPGQRIVWPGRTAWRAAWPRPGDTIGVQTPSRVVTVYAGRSPLPPSLLIVAVTMIAGSLAVLVFAGILCYRRPGVMTIAFWVFVAANFNVGWLMNIYAQAPESVGRPIVLFILAILGGWSYYPMVWFALRFPDDRIPSRAMRIADSCWTVVSIAALVFFVVNLAGVTFGDAATGTAFEDQLWRYTVPQNVPSAVALAALFWVYARSNLIVRQRVLWAIVGLVLMNVFEMIGNFTAETSPATYFIGNVALMLAAFCPLAMIYAVFKHRLLDISFVVNRALVYTTLTALIVLVVGFVDWVVSKYLFETRAALAVDAVVAIGLGLVLQRVHGALERAADRMIFASRHAAEKHIDRVIAGLTFAKTHATILQAVVEEPCKALDLVTSAVFIDDGKGLVLQAQYDWDSIGTPKINRDDPLARLLLCERNVVDIPEARWRAEFLGFAPRLLDIAVPLLSRNELLGIALYGRHRNGTAIDPEERRLLRKLCESAAVAYEAVELASAREQLAALTPHRAHVLNE
jgi:hypothetical protein